ncbi:S8 family serine peptidase [Nonomuraea dietziae]|uniref:S8 family serine peptidase n=1 Tax=Nonomuraea dietziae TaxID=65515 RepID=UPI0033F7E469
MKLAISVLLLLALPAPALAAAAGTPYLAGAANSTDGAAFARGPAEGPAHAVTAAKGRARAITLITGDTVRLGQGGGHVIERGPGRENITFAIDQVGDRLQVVPSDAAPLLASGRLDSRLFDVANLLDFGYDGHRHLPLIISHDGPMAKSGVRDGVATAGARVVRELPSIDALAVHVEGKDRTRFWAELTARGLKAAGVKKVWLDGRMRPTLETSVPQIGAPAAWERGLTGAGVKVGVVDTGVDATHPDLAGRIAGQRNFTSDPDEDDVVGHGTHVASTIVGGGEASGGRNRGVAHGATVLSAKACMVSSCEESAIIAGMQWVAEQGAKVVNLSLSGRDDPGVDPVEQALEDLTARHRTLFVVAAGNNGTERSVGSPGSADSALTVGAVDRNEQRAAFSSQGPRVGDHALKPDITAPGVGIVAARSRHTQEGRGSYHAMSGTSMAAPHVAGAAAIVAAQHPDWSPAQLKAVLMASARPGTIGVFGQGAGRVDVAQATTQFITANPPGMGFGQQRWPHTDDEPITRTLTYTNAGPAPVTLDLAVRALDAAGRPLDAALFSVSPRSVTVAAGGSAEVSVTADTRGDLPDALLGGYLTATGGGNTVSTPLGVDREVESYDLTLNQNDRDGRPATSVTTVLRLVEGGYDDMIMLRGQQASTTLRLPKGTWAVGTTFLGAASTLLVHPGLALTGPRTLDLDARLGLPLSITPPDPKVKQVDAQLGYRGQLADGPPFSSVISRSSFETLYGAQLGGDQTYPYAMSKVSGTWALPSPEGGTDNSPYLYHLGYFTAGRMVTGFQRTVTQQELATVKVDYAQQLAGTAGSTSTGPQPRDLLFPHWYTGSGIALPSVQTEYVNTDDGIRWQRWFHETDAQGEDEVQAIFGRAATYQRGRTHAEHWNRGVFAPVGGAEATHDAITRTGDLISVNFNYYHGDGQGRPGSSQAPRQRSALYRDGRLVAEGEAVHSQPFFVPPEAATYRVETEAERDEPFTSTRIFSAWTFRSEHAPGTVQLPSAMISFAPALNNRNVARGGVPFTVPVTVWQTPGTGGRLKDLNVEVSTDDGATWSIPKLVRTPAGGVVFLRNPATGHVSLRAKATDVSGNTVEQTIIRAYRVG